MLKVSGLTKKYGGHVAVGNISFEISEGEIVGFLGPNGAGKSSIMNMLTGCYASTYGEILINNYDMAKEPKKAKSQIGYLPENFSPYLDMRVHEYLNFSCDLKEVKMQNINDHILKIMSILNISDRKNSMIKHLSKGYKQRLGLAQALIGDPAVLILDEPTVGLDPNQIVEFRRMIKSFENTNTIIFASHILSEIEVLCGRVIIIDHGVITMDCNTDGMECSLEDLFIKSTHAVSKSCVHEELEQ